MSDINLNALLGLITIDKKFALKVQSYCSTTI